MIKRGDLGSTPSFVERLQRRKLCSFGVLCRRSLLVNAARSHELQSDSFNDQPLLTLPT